MRNTRPLKQAVPFDGTCAYSGKPLKQSDAKQIVELPTKRKGGLRNPQGHQLRLGEWVNGRLFYQLFRQFGYKLAR